MTRTQPSHLAALIEAAASAIEALDNYSDVIDRDDGLPYPNHAMIALMELRAAYENYMRKEFPKEEEGELL